MSQRVWYRERHAEDSRAPAADQGRYLHPDLYDGQPLTELARSPLTARNRPT